MSASVRVHESGRERHKLPSTSGPPAIATLPTAKAEGSGSNPEVRPTWFRDALREAIDRTFPKQEIAARAAGRSEGRFSTNLTNGSVNGKDVEALGVALGLALSEVLQEKYGALADSPIVRGRAILREMAKLTDELRQLLDHLDDAPKVAA